MLMAILLVCSAAAGQVKTEVLWPGGDVRVSALSGATAKVADGAVLMDVAESEPNRWPAVYFDFPTPRDLSSVAEVRVTVTNRCAQTLRIGLKVKGDTQQGQLPENSYRLRPFGESTHVLRLYAERWVFDKPHGLVGLKRKPHVGGGSSFSLGRVRSLSVYLPAGTRNAAVGVGRIELVGDSGEKPEVTVLKADELCPWVDEFGQATFAEYPDKVHSEAELRARMADEEREFREIPSGIPSADRFGGWADGPQLAATGHFRTEKVNGKWWLVDPDGHLFFAHGVNYAWEQIPTGVTRRERYFEKLPPETGDTAAFWKTHTSPAPANHNFYSDPTNVPFKTFSFTAYSLYRKFGEGWERKNILNNERRMRTWGLNTLTSSPLETIRTMCMPYVVGIGPQSRKIASVKGYWAPLLDPFAPEFAENCRKSARIRAELGTNEYCIGWTAHNELSWGADGASLAKSVLKAPDDQPAKVALLGILAARGKTEATATEEDLRQLGEAVADKYYSTVRAAIKEVAPHALYLGDRNDKTNPEVFRAASRHLDVITVNVYDYRPTRELPDGSVDKPFLVTEFHFGCYDTGYFYASLLPVKDQKTRADCYRTYLRAALDDPRYVGACWFCWRDCPISGDWNEGANAQCGLVSVADIPYAEMVRAMRDVSSEMYRRRSGATAERRIGAMRPSALFTDHAVLRRSAATPVFGLADPGERVRVSLGTACAETTAGADGKWLVRLDLRNVRGEALELRMNDCVARDVLVGEVWLCSGQSNMEFTMASADDAAAENRVTNRLLRCFVVNHGTAATPQREVRGRWLVTEPGSTMRMTAVGYHFAKELQGQLKTPFGIIQSAVGASTIEAWCDPVTMASDPAGKRELDRQIAFTRDYRTYEKKCEAALAAWAKRWNRADRSHTGVPAEGWCPLEGRELESILRGPGAVWYRRTIEVNDSKPFQFVRKRFIESQWAFDESSVEVYWKGARLTRRFPDDPIEKNTEIYEIPAGSGKGELAVRVFSPERILDVLRYFFVGNVRLDRAGWTTVEEFALPPLTAEMRASHPPRQLQCMRQHWPTGLFNAMIAPLVPVGLSGVIWYQGESNARRSDAYGNLFEAMIRSWRTLFGREDLPFAWCQLAAYQGKAKDPAEADDSWPCLRAQQQRALRLPMTGQAVLIDAGEENDIHPRDKRTPGSRLAAWALNRVYGRTDVPFRGPHLAGAVRDGSSVRVEFADVGKGLMAQGLGETYPRRTKVNDYGKVARNSPQAEVEGFALAGADGVWHWADRAEIDGNGVRVSAKAVPEPLAIRYGWARNPWVNLYNADGFPAEPFERFLK